MRPIKCLVITLIVIISNILPSKSVINKCGKIAASTEPTTPTDCTSLDPDDATCCYVKVQVPIQNTLTTTKDISYCALIPGAYVRQESIDEFRNSMPSSYKVLDVNCNSALYTFSLLFLVALFILIL